MDSTADYTTEQALYYNIWDSISFDGKRTAEGKVAQRLYGIDTVRAAGMLWDIYWAEQKAKTYTRADFEDGGWVSVPAGEIAALVLTCAVNTYTVEGRIDRIDSVRVHAGRQEIVVEGPGTISLYKPTEMVEVASRNRMNG